MSFSIFSETFDGFLGFRYVLLLAVSENNSNKH